MTPLKTLTTGMASAALTFVLLTGCAPRPNGGLPPGVTQAQSQACQQRAEAQYRAQNRGEIYRNDSYATSTLDSPFSGNGLTNNPASGLGAQFGRDQDLQSCYNSGPARDADPLNAPVRP